MYSDCKSYKYSAQSIIALDESILRRELILDSRLFYLALGIIREDPEIFRMITLGERPDLPIIRLGEAMVSGDSKILEGVRSNFRVYNLGLAILKNEHFRLDYFRNDQNFFNFSIALTTRNIKYLNELNDDEVIHFLGNINDIKIDGLKNVIWDESFILKCLKCSSPILPDSFGFMHYYFSSSEDKRVMNTTIYYREVYRHRFYKFCSKECCEDWVTPKSQL